MTPTRVFLFLIFIFSFQITFAQNKIFIKGTVKSSDGNLLSNATLVLLNEITKDSIKKVSDENGRFEFNITNTGKYKLLISYIGYNSLNFFYQFSDKMDDQQLGDIIMIPSANTLQNVTLESQRVQIKEDTVSYRVDSTMYRKNDNVEALLKNLPGVQVDKDGTITAQGKQVTKVKVNGKDFFSGDVTTATRELNADMVDRIQIIDDYGDQASFTGIKDGDPTKTMNIVLKKDKNKGYFGNVNTGVGSDSRYQGSLSINKFNNEQQLSLLGNANNINASLFNFGSMGGPMGNMMGGMAKSMGIGSGGAGAGSVIGNSGNNDGLNELKTVGINYRDNWSPKVSVYGSYSYSNKATSTLKKSTQENIYQNESTTYVKSSDNFSAVENHRFSFNMEFKIDSMNYLKFSPSFSFNRTDAQYNTLFNSQINSNKNSEGSTIDSLQSHSPNISSSLLYNHRFNKKGRFVSFNFNYGQSGTISDEEYENLSTFFLPGGNSIFVPLFQFITQDNSSKNYGGKISYSEPISKIRNLEFNYAYNYQLVGNNRKNYNIDPVTMQAAYVDSSSNNYNNEYVTNRFGLNLKTTLKKYNYTFGFSVQPATINSRSFTTNNEFKNSLVNFYPVIRLAYNFSKSRSLNINYNGNTSQPSNAQLQPITDKSNPQFITVGNPNLKPEFTNTFSMRYNNFDFISGNVFFGNISASFTQDKIVNSIKLLKGGVQETKYTNTNGYFTLFGFYNMSHPIKNRKYVFNLGGNVGYYNNLSYIRDSLENNAKNIGKNWIIGQRISVDIKIKKWVETTLTTNYSLNSNQYTLQKNLDATTVNWKFSNTTRLFLPRDFIINYDVEKSFYYGLSANATSNPLIINSGIEKQMLKKKNLSLKVQAYDLLNQNIGIGRTVSSTGYTDERVNRLGQYFMFSAIFRINKFSMNQQGNMQMGMPGGGPDGMKFRGGF